MPFVSSLLYFTVTTLVSLLVLCAVAAVLLIPTGNLINRQDPFDQGESARPSRWSPHVVPRSSAGTQWLSSARRSGVPTSVQRPV